MSDQIDDEDKIPDYLKDNSDDAPEFLPDDPGDLQTFAAVPVESHLDIPTDGSVSGGLYMTHSTTRLYGTAKTINIIKKVGVEWVARHPNSAIGIGDISKRGGGPISGHASHRKGVDFDVRPMRSDGQRKAITIHDSAYSRQLTSELIGLFVSNGILRCTHVFFNDAALWKPPVQKWPNHDNHFHVRFVVG
ncbi:penicillin-insensitive murein endopeptidase [Methylobacterium brachiatum]|uniref:penicillin-insensitive murein endopeptidase n=1 Tax=Methylobacterium brachiatum TaxID=269660 RepID=UPI00244C02F2|nr:penicillin-insensitive murein endopeptidase [Methylobacterium brachiatum]MDH2313899.1 penicillin-insensitive murein endopeptidase [Methylobacterium brachiatum]